MNLGRGIAGKTINLDIGAVEPGYRPFLSDSGFSAPQVPQVMALSPGTIVYQAKLFRDQSASIKDEASDLLDKTKAYADQAKRTADNITILADQARIDAATSSKYASDARSSLNEIELVFNKTSLENERLSNLTRRNEELEKEIRLYANESASNATAAMSILNKINSICSNIALIHTDISAAAQEIDLPREENKNYANQVAKGTNTSGISAASPLK